MRLHYSFATSLFLLFSSCLLAQNQHDIQMDGSSMRHLMQVSAQGGKIRLCNLIPGNTYAVFAVAAVPDQPERFTLTPGNRLKKQGEIVYREGRQNTFQFKAAESCAEMNYTVLSASASNGISMYLSVACLDCPEKEAWKAGFKDKAEALLANLTTSGGIGASSLITNTLIGGDCFQVSNITSTGNVNSRGTFNNGATNIGINTGVVLCTGNVNILPGPNNTTNANGGFGVNSPNDADLATLTTGDQYDVTRIEFDFTPTTDMVQFEFVFGSEEYCEYAGSNFNDAFGFFISGPGITGVQNVALIPNTTTPVTINNVNHLTNTAYYVNNNTFAPCTNQTAAAINECQLDGWTTVLTATINVQACQTYHIKLAIADIADAVWSSAVFLKAGSFNAGGTVKTNAVYPAGQQFIYEDCGPGGFISFIRASGDVSQPVVINFTVGGTATPGVDYAALVSPIIIPAGQTQVLIPITAFADLIIEGDETIVLTLENPCSCTSSEVTFVIKDKPPLEVTLSDQTICGGSNATLSPGLTGGIAPFTYQWSNNATTPTINVNTPGTNTYTVTVTDKCGTTATAQSTVIINPSPTANLTGSGVFCAGASSTVNLTLTMTGVGPWTVTYNAAGNQVTETFTSSPVIIPATQSGTYNLVSIVSDNGCPGTVSGNVNLTEVTVNLNLTPVDPACNGSTNGTITSSPSGGTAPYTYNWSTNVNTPNQSGLGPGTYTATVTSSQGCTATAEVTLTEPPLLTVNVTGSTNIDCNNPQGNAQLDVSGGTPGYTFLWSNGSSAQNPNFSGPGTYTVTVTDSKNCKKNATVTITANTTQPTAVIVPPQQVNCNTPEITLNATGSSQGAPYTFEWGGPGFVCCETTLQPQVNQGGTYTITVTNTENGCTKTASVTVQQNTTPPNVNINTPPNIGCNQPTISLNGNGSATGSGITYQWSTNDGNIVSGGTTLNPQVNQAGTYTLVVSNSNTGCTNSATVTVNGNTIPPVANIAPPNIVNCYSPEITIDATGSSQGGNFTYNWSGPAGGINSGGNSLNPQVDQPGTYTITITDTQNNCTATASVTVQSNLTQPTAVAAAPPPITCANPEIIINGNGSSTGSNFTYQWTAGGNGNIVSGETTLNPVVNGAGTYTLVVTNTDNGCTKSVTVTVNANNTPPNININTPANIGCNQPTITLSGSGSATGSGITYQWTTVDGNIVSGGTTLNPQVNQAGTYTLVVTNNNNGCTSEESVTVNGNTIPPVAVINPPQIIDCYSPEITLDASGSSQGGNFTYNWGGPSGGINSGGNTLNPQVDLGGTYTLTITDTGNNCTTTASVTVQTNLTQPVAVVAPPQQLTCTTPQITLNGTGSSTGSNFTYEWITGGNANIVSGETTLNPVVDQPGTYTLVVTNTTNGCTKSVTVTVPANQNFPVANAGQPLVLNCLHPTVQLQGSGSTGAGFTLQWTPTPGNIVSGGNTFTPTVNQPGFYILVVTNTASGCTSEDVVEVTENFNVPEAVIAPPDQLNCYFPQIELDASASSQGANYTYQWSSTPPGGIISGNGTPNPIINKPGTYTLTITDTESGCTKTAQVTVTQNITPPLANAGPGGQISCQNPTYTMNATASSGANFYYEWHTNSGNILSGETTLSPVVDAGGTYTLVVTNSDNGCTASSTVNITVNQNFPIAIGGPDLEMNCQNNGLVTLNGAGSSTGPAFTYQWTANPGNIVTGANTLTPKVNEGGFYTLVVTNTQNGCTDEAEVWVNDNIIYPVPVIQDPQQLNCAFTSVILDASSSTTSASGAYQWTASNGGNILSGANSANPEINQPGTYTLVIVNQDNFCTATAAIQVTQNIQAPAAVAAVNGVLTCQFPQVDLSGNGSSQGPEFFYQWTTANGNIVSGELTLEPTVSQPGTYTLTVFNNDNGCTNTANAVVTTSQVFPTANAGAPANLSCAQNQVILNGNASSQGALYAYVWSTPNGNIVSGGNTLAPTVNAPGQYDLQVVNLQNGCVSLSTVNVGTDYLNPSATVAPGGTLSCTITSLNLDGSGSSTGNNFTYSWSTAGGNILSGQNTLSPSVNGVGTYTLLITNTSNGCTSTAATTVGADASLPSANAGPSTLLTCTVQQATLQGSGSTGSQFTYQWTGPSIVSGADALTAVVNGPGAYQLLITNTSNGCTAVSAVNIPQDIQLPVTEAGPPAQLDCTHPTQTLDGTGSSTGAGISYAWTALSGGYIVSGSNTLSPVVNQPGTYQLVVSNALNGCTTTDQVAITQDIALPVAEAGPAGLITCTNPTVALSGSGSTGSQFTYLWTTPNGNIASGSNTLSPVTDAPGVYNLLITNVNNGCTATDVVQVDKDANVPLALALVTGELNCVVDELQLNGNNSSQASSIVYSWTTAAGGNIVSGGNTLTPTVNAPGQYTLEVFNTANNCKAYSTVIVNLNLAPPVANAGTPAIISCLTPVLTLNGNGSSQGANYTYLWNSQNGNILNGANTTNPQVNQSGFYTIQVTDQSNGCTATSTVQIILDQNTPESNPGPSPTLTCTVLSTPLNGTTSSNGPQFTYTWTTSNGAILSGANTLTPVVGAPGMYQLAVYNSANGCLSVDSVLVYQDIVHPQAEAGPATTLTCSVVTAGLNGAGSSTGSPFTYLWSTQNGQIISGNTTLTPVVGDPGVYNLLVTNTQNGCTTTDQVTIPEDVTAPSVAAAVNGELTCAVQTLPLSGAGSSLGAQYTYLWTTTGTGQIDAGATTLTPVVSAPGQYTLLVTNTINGCTSTAPVSVSENITAPQVNAGTDKKLTCTLTQLSLNGSGNGGVNGVSYTWSGPGIVSGANTAAPVIDEVGAYILVVTDLYNGCTSTDQVQIIPDVNAPTIVTGTPAVLSCTVLQVPILMNGTSTGSQFSYTWNGPGIVSGGNSLVPIVNLPGNYTITVSSSINGCTATASVSVNQNVVLPTAEAGDGFELTCSVEQGVLSAAGSSSGGIYAYNWATTNGNIMAGANSLEVLVNEVGMYTLTVTNTQTGCTAVDQVQVTRNTNYPSDLNLATELPACGGQPGFIHFEEVIGGVGPYLYSIDNGATFKAAEEFNGLTPGTYALVVQDANGCEYEESLTFPVPVEPQVTLPPDISLAFGESTTLTATLNIPLSQVQSITWTPMESITPTNKINVVTARPFETTLYTVTIVNIDGCEDRAQVLVDVGDPNVWAPNAISPINQDGYNDYFTIYARDRTVKVIHSLQIYDRWGNQVFYTEGIQPNVDKDGWDGTFRGQALNPAVFVWWAEVELESGRRFVMKGDVTIVR
jgi:gliding motility-associated-like protein